MEIVGIISMVASFVILIMKFRNHSKFMKIQGRTFGILTFYEALFPIPINNKESYVSREHRTLIGKINKLTYSFYLAFAVYLIVAYTL